MWNNGHTYGRGIRGVQVPIIMVVVDALSGQLLSTSLGKEAPLVHHAGRSVAGVSLGPDKWNFVFG